MSKSEGESFFVRAAQEADYPVFARLFLELGVPEAPPPPGYFVENIVPHALMICEGPSVVGYAYGRPRGTTFHVLHVVADPKIRRRGVGASLMNAMAARARDSHFSQWMLNVKPNNAAAIGLYERFGFRTVMESVSMAVEWTATERLPRASARFDAGVVAPVEDAQFEAAMSLSRGEIGNFRALSSRVMVGVLAAGEPMGFAAFDPHFPGAAPFRVRNIDVAAALFDGMRPYAKPEFDGLRVFVEGDKALEDAITAAGGRVVLRALRMAGELPREAG